MSKKKDLPPLAVAIAAARRHLGLEQADLAYAMGVSVRSISRWETGDWLPVRKNHAGLLTAFSELPPPMLRELTRLLVGVDPGLPPPSSPPVPAVDPKAAMESLVFRVAEDLDLGPRRVRAAIATVLEGLEKAGLSPKEARASLAMPAASPRPPPHTEK